MVLSKGQKLGIKNEGYLGGRKLGRSNDRKRATGEEGRRDQKKGNCRRIYRKRRSTQQTKMMRCNKREKIEKEERATPIRVWVWARAIAKVILKLASATFCNTS